MSTPSTSSSRRVPSITAIIPPPVSPFLPGVRVRQNETGSGRTSSEPDPVRPSGDQALVQVRVGVAALPLAVKPKVVDEPAGTVPL
ncbi:hypothetical protein GCM10010116_39550 [Microbispora rosea subsp. aerata]|nr:hypothetical protein GCM10010116_39550 [Microbispora rosea subsp. aerata]GIH57000.1 hypothetical protein Mro02_39140 [Microbispora rosea subsp. aerata]GLJ83458.1 hypothetical protein GCM10017588_21860 [Microbispora rosea subsp. aerata]